MSIEIEKNFYISDPEDGQQRYFVHQTHEGGIEIEDTLGSFGDEALIVGIDAFKAILQHGWDMCLEAIRKDEDMIRAMSRDDLAAVVRNLFAEQRSKGIRS